MCGPHDEGLPLRNQEEFLQLHELGTIVQEMCIYDGVTLSTYIPIYRYTLGV